MTPYGQELKPVMRALALWGLRSIDAPTGDDDLAPGWLYGALDTVFAPVALPGSFEFPNWQRSRWTRRRRGEARLNRGA